MKDALLKMHRVVAIQKMKGLEYACKGNIVIMVFLVVALLVLKQEELSEIIVY